MTKCCKCHKALRDWMKEEGYNTVYRCSCGMMNYTHDDG
jgi:predicted sulfurtransferase